MPAEVSGWVKNRSLVVSFFTLNQLGAQATLPAKWALLHLGLTLGTKRETNFAKREK